MMSRNSSYANYLLIFLLQLVLLVCGCRPETSTSQILPFTLGCPDEENEACAWHIAYQHECNFSVGPHPLTGTALVMAVREGVGYVVRDVKVNPQPIMRIATLQVNLSSEDIKGKGAGITLTALSADSLPMHYAQMRNEELLSGTGSETQVLQLVIPENAATIRAGLIAYGPGKATFSNVRLEVIDVKEAAPSSLAKNYIDAVIDTIARHSLMHEALNIEHLRDRGYRIAGQADSYEDVHLAVRYLIGELGDHHSFLMTDAERKVWAGEDDTGEAPNIKYSSGRRIDDFGYLNVPGFHANVEHLKESFADSLRSIIARLQAEGIKGWIVDLRENDGGNMYPMLGGLEPLFSTDTLGFLVDIRGQREYWGRGASFKAADGEDYVLADQPTAPRTQLPMAVLYGNRTGSSGEIVILSFVGNARTRSFGQPSFGLTTGNGNFYLPDSSYLFLASTVMADRTGKVYGDKVIPDSVIEESQNETDETLAAAVAWLESQ